MREFVQRVNAHPNYSKALEWGKLITVTGSAQVAAQALGFASAILVIRMLPTQEYALYTLANTMLANMLVLADSGIGSGIMAEGGKVWQDPQKMGAVLVTGLSLRKKFAMLSLLIFLPALLYLLRHHNASWLMSVMICLSIIPTFTAGSIGSVYEALPRLRQDIFPLQKIQLSTASGRFILLILSIFALPMAFIACFVSGLAQIWTNRQLYKLSSPFANYQAKPNAEIKKRLLALSARIFPEAVYICLSGQITIWLISLFGSTQALASAGALTRLSMVVNLFTILFGALVVPRFARMTVSSIVLLKRYIQIQLGMLFFATLLIVMVWIFSDLILAILGHKYEGLNTEVVLMITGSSIYVIGQATFALCASRGWVINPAISIPVSIMTIALSAFCIGISSLKDIFLMNICVAAVYLLMNVAYGFVKIIKTRNTEERQALHK